LESETNNDDGGPALLTSVGVDNDSQCILLIFEDSNKSDFITL
jgi:hypothetical protein